MVKTNKQLIMKKFVLLIFMSFFLINCGKDPVMTKTELSVEAKQIIPYTINEIINWKDQAGTLHTGKVSWIKTNRYILSSSDEIFDNEEIETNIDFETYRFVIKQRSTTDPNKVSYTFEYVVNNKIETVFDMYDMPLNAFRNIVYQDQIYYNVVIARSYSYNGDAPVLLMFSKTKGIEYVQFYTSKWFKISN